MLPYLTTTTSILGWCALFAAARALAAYWRVSRPGRAPPDESALGPSFVVPALVAGPVVVVLAFKLFAVNLHVPVGFFATPLEMTLATAPPALVLVIASGLWTHLGRGVAREYAHWRAKPFATAGLAFGRAPRAALRRVVLATTMTRAFGDCLPWLFGELVIVETVFGAPGLGLDAWHLARTRDLAGLAGALAGLSGLYLAATLATALAHRWIGRRLESYA